MPALPLEGYMPMGKSLRLWTCTDLGLGPPPCVTVHCDLSGLSFLSYHRQLWIEIVFGSDWHWGGGKKCSPDASYLPETIPQHLSHSQPSGLILCLERAQGFGQACISLLKANCTPSNPLFSSMPGTWDQPIHIQKTTDIQSQLATNPQSRESG